MSRAWYELTPEKLAKSFWAKVDKRSDDECWEWTAGRSSRGYGNFMNVGAHRMSIYLATGAMPEPHEYACHTCDNPPCVNPGHLYAGTPLDNQRDRWARNPLDSHCGNGHPRNEENSKVNRRGYRSCRACKNATNRVYMRGYRLRKLAERDGGEAA